MTLINCLKKDGVKCRAFPELVVNRRVLDFISYAGTYGPGGPGFFALQLATNHERPAEWLICTLWGAGSWMQVDGRWLEAHPEQYAEQKPWRGSYKLYLPVDSEEEWDEFTPRVVGGSLHSFACGRRSCRLGIGDLELEINEDPGTRPVYPGNKKRRVFRWREDLRNAWILADRVDIEI